MRATSAATSANPARRRRQRGFSLVEVAMVLAIAALLIAGVMLFFSNASQARQTNDAMAQVGAIQQAVRSLYAGQPNYTGLDTATVAQSKQVPNKWVSGTALVNPFGSAVNVAANTPANTFTVEFTGVPDAACSKMVTMDLGNGVQSVSVDGATGIGGGRAFTPAEANTACGTGGNAHAIVWTFF